MSFRHTYPPLQGLSGSFACVTKFREETSLALREAIAIISNQRTVSCYPCCGSEVQPPDRRKMRDYFSKPLRKRETPAIVSHICPECGRMLRLTPIHPFEKTIQVTASVVPLRALQPTAEA